MGKRSKPTKQEIETVLDEWAYFLFHLYKEHKGEGELYHLPSRKVRKVKRNGDAQV